MWKSQGEKWDTDPKHNIWGGAEADAANEGRIYRGTRMCCWGTLEETLQGDIRENGQMEISDYLDAQRKK